MGTLPSWAKGQLRKCFRCDFWFPERDPRITKDNKGRWVCKWDFDFIEDETQNN